MEYKERAKRMILQGYGVELAINNFNLHLINDDQTMDDHSSDFGEFKDDLEDEKMIVIQSDQNNDNIEEDDSVQMDKMKRGKDSLVEVFKSLPEQIEHRVNEEPISEFQIRNQNSNEIKSDDSEQPILMIDDGDLDQLDFDLYHSLQNPFFSISQQNLRCSFDFLLIFVINTYLKTSIGDQNGGIVGSI